MSRGLQIASGISVLFTTLAFTHIMFHDTVHFLHGPESHWFVGIHTIAAIVLILLSFTGAYYILTSGRKPSS